MVVCTMWSRDGVCHVYLLPAEPQPPDSRTWNRIRLLPGNLDSSHLHCCIVDTPRLPGANEIAPVIHVGTLLIAAATADRSNEGSVVSFSLFGYCSSMRSCHSPLGLALVIIACLTNGGRVRVTSGRTDMRNRHRI